MYERYVVLRDAKGVKDVEVARATGIAPSTISEWKHNKGIPKADKMIKLADYFGVPLTYFYKEL